MVGEPCVPVSRDRGHSVLVCQVYDTCGTDHGGMVRQSERLSRRQKLDTHLKRGVRARTRSAVHISTRYSSFAFTSRVRIGHAKRTSQTGNTEAKGRVCDNNGASQRLTKKVGISRTATGVDRKPPNRTNTYYEKCGRTGSSPVACCYGNRKALIGGANT